MTGCAGINKGQLQPKIVFRCVLRLLHPVWHNNGQQCGQFREKEAFPLAVGYLEFFLFFSHPQEPHPLSQVQRRAKRLGIESIRMMVCMLPPSLDALRREILNKASHEQRAAAMPQFNSQPVRSKCSDNCQKYPPAIYCLTPLRSQKSKEINSESS